MLTRYNKSYMIIQENISLKPYNTFAINAKADYLGIFRSIPELEILLKEYEHHQPLFVLGGGSNILFTNDFEGIIVKNELSGKELVREDIDYYFVRAWAGENWHSFVLYCLSNDYYGIENLSLIPGCVGASPIQNIGAYGVEIRDVFEELEAYDLQEKRIRIFQKEECRFGYRDSIFKQEYKNRFVILNVTYRLTRQPDPKTGYGVIEQELTKMGVTAITPRTVSDAIIRIRSSKLPNPAVTGNAGSFFKNPVIELSVYEQIKLTHPDAPGFATGDAHVKVPAGWLIEQCGWKGYRKGDAGCYDKQALVLVNYGNATGKEIYALSEEIIQSVISRFGIQLEREVNIL